MSKAQSPTPGPSPRREGSGMLGCLFSCPLYIYNKVKSYIWFRFLWICKKMSNFIDILLQKICLRQIIVLHLHKTKIKPSYE